MRDKPQLVAHHQLPLVRFGESVAEELASYSAKLSMDNPPKLFVGFGTGAFNVAARQDNPKVRCRLDLRGAVQA